MAEPVEPAHKLIQAEELAILSAAIKPNTGACLRQRLRQCWLTKIFICLRIVIPPSVGKTPVAESLRANETASQDSGAAGFHHNRPEPDGDGMSAIARKRRVISADICI